MASKEKSNSNNLDTVDITYLIDDDFIAPEFENLDTSKKEIKSYADDVPTDGLAYKLFPDKIKADIIKNCKCRKNCGDVLMKDQDITKHVQHFRSTYYVSKLGNERSTKTLGLIRSSMCTTANGNERQHNFMGHVICMKKWIHLLGISSATYYRALILIRSGFYSVENARKPVCSNIRGLDACGFIDWFLDKYGDYSPERQRILLPSCINIKFIYDDYLEKPGPHLKRKHFYAVFKKNFGKIVSFTKTRNINPCDICLKASNELPKLHDGNEKQQLKQDLHIHLERQSNERKDYYKKRREACVSPLEAISIILDGMDQAKTNLPHFKGWCRPKSAGMAVKTHVTGAIVHGHQEHFYVDVNQWPHDPNMTITCLLNSLCHGRDTLPPKLYLQCDNCGRENKNKYVLGFLGYLCLTGYVKEVFLSFLLKGHTHEDIDQRFSKVSHHMRTVNAMILEQLTKALEESFSNPPNVEVLGKVWDVKGWIEPSLNEMSNHSYPHQFWIYCDRPGNVALKTRNWSTDTWSPGENETQLELFSLDTDGDQLIPRGVPNSCPPDYQKLNLQQVKSVIEKMKVHLSYNEYEWWKKFIAHPEMINNSSSPWPLLHIQPMYRIENVTLPVVAVTSNEVQPSCLRPLLDIEEQTREVVTKKKKRK